MSSFFRSLAVMILLCAVTIVSAQKKTAEPPTKPLDASLFKSLKARSIGPAVMSGRVSDIAIDPQDSYTFYVALGTGGVMKTSDNGGTFSGIFEKEAVAAVGAVALAPSNPKYVWVGTGEANDRNSSSWGNGVYLSTDAGGDLEECRTEREQDDRAYRRSSRRFEHGLCRGHG